jgi:hypothetical protein
MTTFKVLQAKVKKTYKRRKTWSKVGQEFGINKGLAYRIAQGYEPKTAHVRVQLGLPALAPAPVCSRCGKVHVTRRCTEMGRTPKDLFAYKPEVLLYMLKNREPVA